MNIKELFKRKPDVRLEAIRGSLTTYQEHLIAIARLCFIKPSTLVREAQNTKVNAEYLLELIKEQEKLMKGENER